MTMEMQGARAHGEEPRTGQAGPAHGRGRRSGAKPWARAAWPVGGSHERLHPAAQGHGHGRQDEKTRDLFIITEQLLRALVVGGLSLLIPTAIALV
jgi:hypothetical protein